MPEYKVFLSVNAKAVALLTLQMTEFADQFNIRLLSQLIRDISIFSRNYLAILIAQLFLHSQYRYYQYYLRVLI